jgi:hypothetical protein
MSFTFSVDRRVELMSTIFLLAGNPEYNRAKGAYALSVKKYFQPYIEHEAVKLAKILRSSYSINYDAPMSLAVRISDNDKLVPLVDLEDKSSLLDYRWSDYKLTRQFLDAASAFIADTKFYKMFADNQSVYDSVLDRARGVLSKEASLSAWLNEFYGAEASGSFHIIVRMLADSNNYGPSVTVNGMLERYCIVALPVVAIESSLAPWQKTVRKCVLKLAALVWFGKYADSLGLKLTTVHEFGHSYANPLVDSFGSQLESAGKLICNSVEDQMRQQAYVGWLTVMYESLVRAVTIRYFYTYNDKRLINCIIKHEKSCHFHWMEKLVDLLGEYEAQRDVYPTLNVFFPRIISFFNDYARTLNNTASTNV